MSCRLLSALCAVVALTTVQANTGAIETLETEDAFEKKVMQSSDVWVILFTSKTRIEECERVQQRFELLSATQGASYSFGTADIDNVKAFSSEFNVRAILGPVSLALSSERLLLHPAPSTQRLLWETGF